MTCKDCLHVEVCRKYVAGLAAARGLELENIMQADDCEDFKSRDKVIELPCVAGEYVYVIEPMFGESIEHTISRRKIKSIEPHAEIKFYSGWIHDFLSGFGRYIFSTYEAAEQALRERENHAE